MIETGRTRHVIPTDVARSPSDVLRFVVGTVLLLALLLVQWLWGETLVTFASELFQGLSALPSWIVGAVVAGTRVLAVVFLVGGLVLAGRAGGSRMLGTAAVAAAVAAPLEVVLERLGPDAGETAVDVPDALGPLLEGRFPTTAGLAAMVAAVTAAAPWLSRRARRLCWLFVMGLVITYFLATPASFDSVQAMLVGWVAGAAALVVLVRLPAARPPRP